MAVKVLILEDNPVARSFLCRVVRESFSDAETLSEAGDLETARQLVNLGSSAPGSPGSPDNEPFKLILVDLELPDGRGLELLAELAHYPATKIVTTLYADDDHLFPALQGGAQGYLLKEDRFEVLVEELQKIALGQLPLSPAIARRMLSHFRQSSGLDSGAAPLAAWGNSKPSPLVKPTADNERLSSRETEVLTYLSKGFTIKEIASLMGIKWFSINDHIKSIYMKLERSSRADTGPSARQQPER